MNMQKEIIAKLSILIFTVIAITIPNISFASEGDVWLTPVNQNVDTSQNFDIEIHVDTGTKDLASFNLDFNFDATKTTIDTTKGDNGVDKGTSEYIITPNANNIASGQYILGGINAAGISGNDIHIATIHAKTMDGFTSGTTSISMQLNDALKDHGGLALTTGTITGGTISYANRTVLHRFFNKVNGEHLYTTDTVEKDYLINNLSQTWNYEGMAYYVYKNNYSNTAPVYRFFNTVSGYHFYTKSEVEKDYLINNLPVWNYEGIAYYAYSDSQLNSNPVYRFFNKISGEHLYTIDNVEKNYLINNLSATWNYEGIEYYTPTL